MATRRISGRHFCKKLIINTQKPQTRETIIYTRLFRQHISDTFTNNVVFSKKWNHIRQS